MYVRLEKARAIVSTAKLRRRDGAWLVPSQTGHGKGYVVTWQERDPDGWRYANGNDPGYRCTYPDFEHRRTNCKHILAVCIVLTREAERTETAAPDGTRTVTEKVTTTVTKRTTYKQVWPAYNAAQTEEKATFQTLLHDLCAGIPQPEHMKGRRPVSLADMVFASTFKVYSTFSGRRFMTDLKAAQVAGHITRAPHYNTIFKYLEMPELTPILTELVSLSAAPLASVESDFAVDSTGFTTTRFTRWFDHKWGEVKEQHDWKKVHAMVGTKTQIVASVAVSRGAANDSPFFAPLVAKTAQRFSMNEVSADKAYSSKKNLQTVWDADAMPYIPFRSNAVSLGIARVSPLWRRLFHYYNMERDAFLAQYHKRSNVEMTQPHYPHRRHHLGEACLVALACLLSYCSVAARPTRAVVLVGPAGAQEWAGTTACPRGCRRTPPTAGCPPRGCRCQRSPVARRMTAAGRRSCAAAVRCMTGGAQPPGGALRGR